MVRYGVLLLMVWLTACGTNSKGDTVAEGEGVAREFAGLFRDTKPPYSLSDSGLLANKDTAAIRSEAWLDFIPDSMEQNLFGAKGKIRYTPLARFTGKKKETYYLAKATRDNRKAAIILVANASDSLVAILPFLVPDEDRTTRQITTLEENFSIVRSTQRMLPDDAIRDGKDVFAYSEIGKSFDLVMTDPLDDEVQELINPIDTLGKTYAHAGDYQRTARNIVSVRDGRKHGLITVFIHMEQKEGSCTGEIKGDAEIIDANTAVYRTPGDPCVLTLKFGKNDVTLKEEEGCGSRRGLECSFNGTFKRKKEPKNKEDKG